MVEDKKTQQKPTEAQKQKMVTVVLNRPYFSAEYGIYAKGKIRYALPINPGTSVSVSTEEAERLRQKGYVIEG